MTGLPGFARLASQSTIVSMAGRLPTLAEPLTDTADGLYAFPPTGARILAFLKDDCPTCNLVAPVIDDWHRRLPTGQLLILGQTAAGNRAMVERLGLQAPLLDDSLLRVSHAMDLEIVPTLIVLGEDEQEVQRIEGFAREEWRAFSRSVLPDGGGEAYWDTLPPHRPGCGSLSLDPVHAERLAAEASGSPLRARRIEIGSADDTHEFLFDQDLTDGLPVVPPTPERVLKMLAGSARDPQETVAVLPPNLGQATVEKIAINAVMAGCRPDYLPVVIAAIEAVSSEAFNLHAVMATTMGAAPVLVVNGPIRHRLGMNMKIGALGQGNRANATIGRAVRLAVRNIGGAKPGGIERSTLGNPMKFTMCFAEWEERSCWSPLHVEHGFDPDASVVTALAMTSGPVLAVDQTSRSAEQLAGSLGLCVQNALHPRAMGMTNTLLVVCPEHVDTLSRDGYSKEDVRNRIQQVSATPRDQLVQDEISGVGLAPESLDSLSSKERAEGVPKFAAKEDIHIVVAGSDAGKFSGFFHGWLKGARGSLPASSIIEEVA